jgi:hypothetical protein
MVSGHTVKRFAPILEKSSVLVFIDPALLFNSCFNRRGKDFSVTGATSEPKEYGGIPIHGWRGGYASFRIKFVKVPRKANDCEQRFT